MGREGFLCWRFHHLFLLSKSNLVPEVELGACTGRNSSCSHGMMWEPSWSWAALLPSSSTVSSPGGLAERKNCGPQTHHFLLKLW